MKKLLLLIALFLCAAPLSATTFQFAVDPSYVGPLLGLGADASHTTWLNGVTLDGQIMSIDAMLTNDVIATIGFRDDLLPLFFQLDIYTNAPTAPGLAGESSGYVLDPNGNQIGPSRQGTLSDLDNGHFLITLEPFSRADFGGGPTLTLGGVHFDTTFPNTGYTITDARLFLGFPSGQLMYQKIQVEHPVPEPISLALLPFGITGILIAGRIRKRMGEGLTAAICRSGPGRE